MSRIEEAVSAMEEMMNDNRGKMIERIWSCGRGEVFILRYLSEKDSAAIPSEISEAMSSSSARISAVLGSLEKKGQIRRGIDTSNRRQILVNITDEGRRRVRSDMRKMRGLITGIFTEMGEREAADFVRLLKRFVEITNQVSANEFTANNG